MSALLGVSAKENEESLGVLRELGTEAVKMTDEFLRAQDLSDEHRLRVLFYQGRCVSSPCDHLQIPSSSVLGLSRRLGGIPARLA